MAANADRGRLTVISSLQGLKQIKEARPNSLLLQLFSDAKLDETVSIYSNASTQEKKEGYEMLKNLYPTEDARLSNLKQ